LIIRRSARSIEYIYILHNGRKKSWSEQEREKMNQ
jgi:hypothetical protein